MWDDTRTFLYAVEPTFYDLSQGELDAEEICRQVRLGGGTGIKFQVHSQRGYVYYPSEVAPLPPDYEVGRDYVAELIQASIRHGLQLAFSLNVACNPQVAAARPEWRQIEPNGRPHRWGGLDVMCLNTDYMAYFMELLREFVAAYMPDCVWLENFVLLNGCRCEGCARALFDETRLDLASIKLGSPDSRRYAQWRLQRTEQLAWQAAAAAKSVKGDLRVVFSGCNWRAERDRAMGWRPEHTADWMDNVHSDFAVRWYDQDVSEGELIGAYQRALSKAGWCTVEYSPMPFTRLACPPTELRLKAGTVIAAGCRPCVWPLVPMPPGDESGLRYLGEFFSQFRGHEEWLDIQGSFARTGIVHSRAAEEVVSRSADDVLRAWCEALTREHVLWEFVLDADLAQGDFSQYRVLIVPGTPHLSPQILSAIDAWIRAGGAAIFVGEATCYDAEGERLSDFAAAHIMGVSLTQTISSESQSGRPAGYLRVAGTPLTSLAHRLIPTGDHLRIKATAAEPVAHAIPPPEHYTALARDEHITSPAITWRMRGGGKVAYVASCLEAVMGGEAGPAFASAERLVGELVRWLGGERIKIRAPRNVTVQVYRAPRGATVHIVNKPPRSPYVHERVARSGRVEIVIPQTLYTGSVRALDNTTVQWKHEGDRLTIAVSGVAEYRCLQVEGALG